MSKGRKEKRLPVNMVLSLWKLRQKQPQTLKRSDFCRHLLSFFNGLSLFCTFTFNLMTIAEPEFEWLIFDFHCLFMCS